MGNKLKKLYIGNSFVQVYAKTWLCENWGEKS